MHIPRRKLYFFVLLEVFIEIEKVFVSKLREESENSYGYLLSLNWSRLKSEAKKGGGAERRRGGGGGGWIVLSTQGVDSFEMKRARG